MTSNNNNYIEKRVYTKLKIHKFDKTQTLSGVCLYTQLQFNKIIISNRNIKKHRTTPDPYDSY